MLKFENNLYKKGIKYIAGVDEVGRGALAGPMAIAAVVLNRQDIYRNNDVAYNLYHLIDDSKKLTAKKREELEKFIKKVCISFSIEVISNEKIDNWGISKCTQVGFFGAIKKLSMPPEHILTDAFKIKVISDALQTNIKGGDSLSISIAAASIVAKVFRDRLMETLHETNEVYQKYRFNQNKAYGTKAHLEAIRKYGICTLHRKSFEPIKSMV